MRCIGFDVQAQEEFLELARRAVLEHGKAYRARDGCYLFVWRVGNGVELWSQVAPEGESILGLNPHFFGRARMRVGITRRIPPPYEGSLDGAFYGWLDPESDENPESGWCPVVFDAPNYAMLDGLELPRVCDVQIAAFPHHMEVYPSEDEYLASQEDGPLMAVESFIPSGTFRPGGESIEPPVAEAIFSGLVREMSRITNADTALDFEHAKIKTLGGEVDVVIFPDAPTEAPLEPGAVVRGTFWLSGLILK
ncbi:hypothetical protein GBA63_18020 [Rubrobacter tropicus]|uniref:Uncharacterized protein n=1 Tax=Rubrobacter tropicus TaxID=2653851 RepID=A0A6G8QCX0_9ACTN|nr:hypothetical protein [Rubrobacter tropicus]QIN84329.1 hypothetical protein GBA63_18020 [Rubrobacter tropicus]